MLFTQPFAEVRNFLKELELIHVRNSKPNTQRPPAKAGGLKERLKSPNNVAKATFG